MAVRSSKFLVVFGRIDWKYWETRARSETQTRESQGCFPELEASLEAEVFVGRFIKRVLFPNFFTTFPPSGQLIPTWIVLMLFISGVCAQSQIYPLLYSGGHATRVGKNKHWTGSNSVAGILAMKSGFINYNFWGTFCVDPYDTLHA